MLPVNVLSNAHGSENFLQHSLAIGAPS
ncbi:hypothetical protein ID866_11359 [Astraeus odoratus]|nr:hypothetical protein ID866_11359 [Astraeus odoratus]